MMRRSDTTGGAIPMRRLTLALLLSATMVGGAGAAGQSPQGDTWASVAKLPDWSGTWALTNKAHEAATKEPRLMKFTPKYQQQQAGDRGGGGGGGAPPKESLGKCLPAGLPGLMMHTIGFEWLFSPGRVTMITENGEVRRIRTDGTAHRSLRDIGATYEGDSIGHWEGKTLVVDTIGFPNGMLLKNGSPISTKNTHYVERITQIDKDHIQIDSVVSDPEIYTEPYKATRPYERVDYPLPEPQCAQTSRYLGGSEDELDLRPPPEE
jgi:hypothetical protein